MGANVVECMLFSKSLSSHEFHKIVSYHVTVRWSHPCFKLGLGTLPHRFNTVGCYSGVRVHKVQRVVDCSMRIAYICLLIVGSPLVGVYCGTWTYPLLDYRQKSSCISPGNCDEEAFFGGGLVSPKHPQLWDRAAWAWLGLSKKRFVYFYDAICPPRLLGGVKSVLGKHPGRTASSPLLYVPILCLVRAGYFLGRGLAISPAWCSTCI